MKGHNIASTYATETGSVMNEYTSRRAYEIHVFTNNTAGDIASFRREGRMLRVDGEQIKGSLFTLLDGEGSFERLSRSQCDPIDDASCTGLFLVGICLSTDSDIPAVKLGLIYPVVFFSWLDLLFADIGLEAIIQ